MSWCLRNDGVEKVVNYKVVSQTTSTAITVVHVSVRSFKSASAIDMGSYELYIEQPLR